MLIFPLASLLLYSALTAGQSYGFVYPNATNPNQADLVFDLGQNIDIQWNSPFKAVKLAFKAEDGRLFQFFSQNTKGNDFTWAVNANTSGSSSPYYYLYFDYYLYFENQVDNSQHYYSARFRVNDPADSATVTVTPTPSLYSSPTNSRGCAAENPSSTNFADNSDSTSLSRSSKIGIRVGVPLVVLALLGLAFLAVWSSWRHSRAAKRDLGYPDISTPGERGYPTDDIAITRRAGYALVQQYPMSELPALNERIHGAHELPHSVYQPQELAASNPWGQRGQ